MFYHYSVAFFHSKLLLDNCASFTPWRMKDLCQKWKVKLIFRGAWKSLTAWFPWPRLTPPPYFTPELRHCTALSVVESDWCGFSLLTAGAALRATACENQNLTVSCSKQDVIHIINAHFGRLDTVTCDETTSRITNTQCLDPAARYVVYNRSVTTITCTSAKELMSLCQEVNITSLGAVVKVWSRGLTWRSQPHTHSNPTNLALFRHKTTLYRFNQGGSYYCRGLKWEQGAEPPEPPHFNRCWGWCLAVNQRVRHYTWSQRAWDLKSRLSATQFNQLGLAIPPYP